MAKLWSALCMTALGLIVSVFFHANLARAAATTYYVGTVNALDDIATHGADPGSPFASLEYAETQAADGDTIAIADGTYTVDGFLDSTKALTWDGESKSGVIVKFTDGSRGIYLRAPSAQRTFQDMTLQNNATDSGPSYLVEVNGADVDTVFNNVKFENGKRGAAKVPAGKVGLTIQNSEILGNISSYWNAVNAAGGYTVSSTTVTLTEDITAPLGVFYQSGASAGEKVTITSSTIDVEDNFYVFRMAFGGLTAPEITNNTVTVSSTFSRAVVDLKRQSGEIITGNDFTIPSTVASAYGIVLVSPNGVASVATVNTNTIRIHNPSGYGILIGDEGGAESVDGSYDGSFIQGNTIYGSAVYGEGLGSGHALMAGFNQDLTISGNTVEGHGYCVVAKYNGEAWASGGITNNTCTNNTYGIRLKGASNVTVTGNTITSNNSANTTAFDIDENGVGEISSTSTVTGNIISIDSGEVYNFRDDSDNGFTSDSNFFDIYDAGAMGNVNGGGQQATLAVWQSNTLQDANSYTWDRDVAPSVQFTSAVATSSEATANISFELVASSTHPYALTFDYAVSNDSTAAGSGIDYTLANGSGTIAAGSTTTSVSAIVVNDDFDENDETILLALSNIGVGVIGTNVTSTHTIEDDDTAAITVTQSGSSTAVTEGAGSDTYTIVLGSAPTSTVTITLSNADGELSLSPASVSFTSTTWDTAATVTVSATNDTDVEDAHSGTISHSVSSVDSNYDGYALSDISVSITDNDENAGCGGCLMMRSPITTFGGGANRSQRNDSGDQTEKNTDVSDVVQVSINNGATQTRTSEVTLSLDAPGAESMAISNQEDFAGASFVSFASSVNWILSDGVGEKTVYVRLRDAQGVTLTTLDTINFFTGEGDMHEEQNEQEDVQSDQSSCPLPIGAVLRTKEVSTVYVITPACTKQQFINEPIFFSYYDSWSVVRFASNLQLDAVKIDYQPNVAHNDTAPIGEGALVKYKDGPKVYVLERIEGELVKRHILNEQVFEAQGFLWESIMIIPVGQEYPNGEQLL